MPNVLNPEPARALAARAAAKIGDLRIADRFERIVFGEALNDPTCLRLADGDDINRGPAWAPAALARGEYLYVFRLSRSASTRFHGVARRLEQTCKLAQTDLDDANASAVILARGFLHTFERADFQSIARKTKYCARIYNNANFGDDDKACCEARSIICANGHVWRRLTTIADLREAGRKFDNCLARTTQGSTYGRRLRRGAAQFWTLTDQSGAPLIVAMAPAPHAEWFNEVRGPHNAHIQHDDPDLLSLARAIGIISGDPPPLAAALGELMPYVLGRRAA